MRLTLIPLLSILLLSSSGCGLLLGNVKPVDEKSEDYGVLDLSKADPDWTKLSTAAKAEPKDSTTTQAELPDVAFQSKSTASVISLNSACRPSTASPEKSLKEFTDLLLLGISDIAFREAEELYLQQIPALQTTIQGKLNAEKIKLRTVVLRRRECVYDLTYIARPEHFGVHEAAFVNFMNSLRLK